MTIDLTARAGLAVGMSATTGELVLGSGVLSELPGRRDLAELRPLLRDPDAAGGPDPVYLLYRGVRRAADTPLLEAAGLRYDLTVTLPGRLGIEHVKTAGHYHVPDDDGVSFPEIYEVVHGRAAFLLQRVADVSRDDGRVQEAWVQLCAAGERIVIPPDCGHVTVNVGETPLVVADVVSRRCDHVYGGFRRRRGAAWHVLADASAPDGLRLERNSLYRDAPEPVLGRGSRWEPFLDRAMPAYQHVTSSPDDYAFLHHPSTVVEELLGLWRE